jgi:Holliday junction resolvase RusA-like endonuclease
MREIRLELHWPPSVNHYKKVGAIVKTKTGKLYQQRLNTDETKTFYFQTYMKAKDIPCVEGTKFRFRDDIALEVIVRLHPPHSKRYDLDNRLKVLLDGLVHAKLISDDAQITRLYVEKLDMIAHGKAIVTIREIV